MKIKVEAQVILRNSKILGNFRVSVPERNLVRIFPFVVSQFDTLNWRTQIVHNRLEFFTFQASPDLEAMFRQTDHLRLGQRTILDLMNKVQEGATEQVQSELAERGRASGLTAVAESTLVADLDPYPEEFEAACDELLALPESQGTWVPRPKPRISH